MFFFRLGIHHLRVIFFSVFQNILVAFNNIPGGLVRSDNSLFAASGDSIQRMKETYQENTSLERSVLEETINQLTTTLSGFEKEVVLIPLIQVREPIKTEENANTTN